jgi:hypothetical protein
MNELTKIDMANLVFSEDKKAKIKNVLCTMYGATDVQYRDLSYGICIDVTGTDSFRFIKNAILKTLDVHEETLTVLGESKRTLKASYVYLPEKDKVLNRRLKKTKVTV